MTEYENDLRDTLFQGNLKTGRASYESFKDYIDNKSRFEEGAEQYEKDMQIFDEDNDGTAPIEDVIRVMKELAHMNDDDVSLFIKKCCLDKPTDEQLAAPLTSLHLPDKFKISQSTPRLFNI